MAEHDLDASERAMPNMGSQALALARRLTERAGGPCLAGAGSVESLVERLRRPPDERPEGLDSLLGLFGEAADCSVDTAGPTSFAHVPGSRLFSAVLGEMLSYAANVHTAYASLAPAFAAMEQSVLRWLCTEFGLPATATGLFTTGGSTSTLTAVVAARTHLLGGRIDRGVVYVTASTHLSVTKAVKIAGLTPAQIRTVPTDGQLRMDPTALRQLIRADRDRGLRPFLLVGTAGTTDTGAVDPLAELGRVAQREAMWFHVDAAYGGFFQLTARGRRLLSGIEHADSIALDPHKGLFMPYGTGVLLMRDPGIFQLVYAAEGGYVRDVSTPSAMVNHCELGIEMTTEFRGARIWLPLRLHGIGAFRDALAEKLELADVAHDALRRDPLLQIEQSPQLSTLTFGLRAGGDEANRRLLDTINRTQAVTLSGTWLGGRLVLRMCILNDRSHLAQVRTAIDVTRQAAAEVSGELPRPGRDRLGTAAAAARGSQRQRARPDPPAAARPAVTRQR